MPKHITPQPSPKARQIADRDHIESIFTHQKLAEKTLDKFHVFLKDGQCFYGWPKKVMPNLGTCTFVCEYENADRMIDFNFSDIDFISVP